MKYILFTLSFFLLLASCSEKENEIVVINPKKTINGIVLKLDKVFNDSTIQLSWPKYTGKGFKSYKVFRTFEVLKNGNFVYSSEELKVLDNPDSLTFTDRSMPFSPEVRYTVRIYADSTTVTSNQVAYNRPGTYKIFNFNEVLINTEKDFAYLYNFSSGAISLFDYNTGVEIVKTSLNTRIGYCALGNFDNGIKNELLVPTGDGWVYILDAESLSTKDKVYIGGEAVTSVLSINEKLFVSSSDRSYGGFYDNSLKVYDRRTKKVISRTGDNNNTRLVYLEGSNTELLDITTNLIPVDLNYYKFNSDGTLLTHLEDRYHGDYPLDPSLVKCFPDGSRIITGSSGTIYTKGMIYERSLASVYSNMYSDFEFNKEGTLIYAANKSQKKIDVINYPSLTVSKNNSTTFNPFRIFRDGNQLICIAVNTSFRNYFLFEKVNL